MNFLRRSVSRILTQQSKAMASTNKTSLSALGPKSTPSVPKSATDYDGAVTRPPHNDRLPKEPNVVEKLDIPVSDSASGTVPGFLHLPTGFAKPTPQAQHHRTAAILLSGAGGGVVGPSSIYLSLAAKLAALSNGIPAIRLDYRYPARNKYCVPDVKAAMNYLEETYGLNRFVLVGWSFGGAPVFTVGGEDKRVVGCATVASQTADTSGIRRLSPRPLLLMHGTADSTLSYSCSERLYDMYGDERGDGELRLYEGDNHSLSKNAMKAEKTLFDFITKCAGVKVGESERKDVAERQLVDGGERKNLMEKGGDLRGPEKVD